MCALLSASVAVLCAPTNRPHNDKPTRDQDQPSEVGRFIEARFDKGDIPSLAVSVIQSEQVVYEGAFGFADRHKGVRATPSTPYYVASVTKALTGLALILLAQDQKISLDLSLAEMLATRRFSYLHPLDRGLQMPNRDRFGGMCHGLTPFRERLRFERKRRRHLPE